MSSIGFLMTVTVVAVSGSSRSLTGCDGVVSQAESMRSVIVAVATGILLSFTMGLFFGRLWPLPLCPIEPKV